MNGRRRIAFVETIQIELKLYQEERRTQTTRKTHKETEKVLEQTAGKDLLVPSANKRNQIKFQLNLTCELI